MEATGRMTRKIDYCIVQFSKAFCSLHSDDPQFGDKEVVVLLCGAGSAVL